MQDLNFLYYKLVKKIINENKNINCKLLILGDQYQCINKWNNSDWRYLKFANQIFTCKNNTNWEKLNLSQSFRMTIPIAEFINKIMLQIDRIKSNRNGIKPDYLILDSFNPVILYDKIKNYLEQGYSYDDFFVLAPSVKSGAKTDPPIRQLANKLSNNGIPIFVPNNDTEELDKRELLNKIVFSTFHQVKGRERKIVLIFNFDQSYFTYYAKNKNPFECCNELYVACSRSKEHLILIHHFQNNYLPFLDLIELKNYCNFFQIDLLSITNNKKKTCLKSSVTELTKHLPATVMKNCLHFFDRKKIRKISNFINIPRKIKSKYGIESVSEITGIAIPSYFEYLNKKKMGILERLKTGFISKHGYDFIDDSEDENEDDLLKLSKQEITPNTLLYISNRWNTYKTGYVFKLNQINQYNWLSNQNLKDSIERLKREISIYSNYEVKLSIKNYQELFNRKLIGFIDCIDNNIVWEIKCVKNIRSEHFLQLAIYVYLFKTKNGYKRI